MTARTTDRHRRMTLGGLVGLLMLAQAAAGLFALWYSHAAESQSRARLGAIAASLDAVRGAQAGFGLQVQEWKNVLLRDRDPALSARHRTAFQNAGEAVQARLARAAQEPGLAAERAPAIRGMHAALLERYGEVLRGANLTTLEGQSAADTAVRGADRALQLRLDELADALAEAHRAEAAEAAATAERRYGELRLVLFVCAGIGLVMTLLLLLLALRRF
jgi:methyl-accepting chemotaxis protein